mmetsp:Transcript_28886/g.59219  ORF Transcript_28886/g.59219 Transcript_28886/m.59219 type:complete len:653 (+) Transcript_28886:36-1994(+)
MPSLPPRPRDNNGASAHGGDDIASTDDASNEEADAAQGGEAPTSYFAEGYTPLAFDMNVLAMINDDDSDNSDAFNEGLNHTGGDGRGMMGEMDREIFSNGYYHLVGAPQERVNGIKDGFYRARPTMSNIDNDKNGISRGNGECDIATDHSTNFETSATSEGTSAGDYFSADFRLLAEQALMGLEEEHQSALQGSRSEKISSNSVSNESINSEEAELQSDGRTTFETTFSTLAMNQLESGNQLEAEESATGNDSETKPEGKTLSLQPRNENSLDVHAIQKAMQSIRLKSPRLATTLDTGASTPSITTKIHDATEAAMSTIIHSISEQQFPTHPTSHAIIPPGPLAAFRRSTPKAKAATANLSRSATISEALLRLWPLISLRRKTTRISSNLSSRKDQSSEDKTLTIHILGADGVECSSEELVRKSVGPFVRWLDAALKSDALSNFANTSNKDSIADSMQINSLMIEFSGPCMPNSALKKTLNLLPQTDGKLQSSGLVSATAVFQQREYHEPFNDGGESMLFPPDLAISFNAGIWGYDSWKPTIACMCESSRLKICKCAGVDSYPTTAGTIFVMTAYTIFECEDDMEVVAEVATEVAQQRLSAGLKESGLPIAHQLWAPEPNPFTSRLERKTASAQPGRVYHENAAWQAWIFGL